MPGKTRETYRGLDGGRRQWGVEISTDLKSMKTNGVNAVNVRSLRASLCVYEQACDEYVDFHNLIWINANVCLRDSICLYVRACVCARAWKRIRITHTSS